MSYRRTAGVDTLGEAKKLAQQYVREDGCAWRIHMSANSIRYYLYPEGASAEIFCKSKPEVVIYPDKIPVYLTQEEKELVEYILRDDMDAQVFTDNTQVRHSLWEKIKKSLV